MHQKTLAKLGGFVVAAGTTAALVGFAAHGTGAYFTSSVKGTISASNGSVGLNVSPDNGGGLNFAGLLPGTDKVQHITYQTTGNGPQDIWILFDENAGGLTNGANASEPFTGLASDAAPGPLGRYGHLKITSTNSSPSFGAASFESYNLANPGPVGSGHEGPKCHTESNGEGGSTQQPATPTETIDFCAPPQFIELADNVTPGGYGDASIAFGYTKFARTGPFNSNVAYKIVATQHGIFPTDQFNPDGTTSFS